MTGAECLLRTLLNNGVDLCLMNPGTSEMQFVSALDGVPAMRGVLCLFEGVCSGAADGYARMLSQPAATLLHLGPGLANGLANFHNARKAHSPVVNIVGEHSTLHLPYDAPLTADTAAFARTVSGWVRVLESAAGMGAAAAEAVAAALQPPGQVATLIVPADFSWSEAGAAGSAIEWPAPRAPDSARVREAAEILRGREPAGLMLGGRALLARGLAAAGRIPAPVFANRYAPRIERGADLFAPVRLPYFPEPAQQALAGLKHLVLVETPPPVSFFGYPGQRSCPAPEDCRFHVLATESEDGTAALEMLAGPAPIARPRIARPALPTGAPLTATTVGIAIGALLPEGVILSDEMVSSGEPVWAHLAGAPRHDHLPVTGGSIGQGLPVALGAALACPDRKVIALEADGSGMYTLQALWSMARERADVVAVIFANRRYRILDVEMRRTGATEIGPRANDMMDLRRPDLEWVKLAQGLGVAASRATTADEFIARFRDALSERGPRLIEAVIEE
ncbi:MAG: acetolactate synthase large subunit [Bryobacterales bacterium]|nr:acetolactate synthase large subunit [Bryobacterales bacterium]